MKAIKKAEDPALLAKLANCYRLTQNYREAEVFYGRALDAGQQNISVVQQYGQVLAINRKNDKAREVFVVFATKNPRAESLVLERDVVSMWGGAESAFEVAPAANLNSNVAEMCPVPFGDGIAFASERNEDLINENDLGWNNNAFLTIYSVQPDKKGRMRKVEALPNEINGPYHNGPVCFTADESVAYFTRIDFHDGDKETATPRIYRSVRDADNPTKWLEAELVSTGILGDQMHPAINPSGTMMVLAAAGEAPGGGKDLYMVALGGDTPQPDDISILNSPGDEVFPRFANDSTLYFASNGHTGMGGLDVFVSYKTQNGWSAPQNVLQPINSPFDDFGLCFFSDTAGYFSSNRKGGKGGDDIYSFTFVPGVQQDLITLEGVFQYNELTPAGHAKVRLMNEENVELAYTYTNDKGEFVFPNLLAHVDYFFMVDPEDPNVTDAARIYLKEGPRDELSEVDISNLQSYVYSTLGQQSPALLTLIQEDDVGIDLEDEGTMEPMLEPALTDIHGNVYDQIPGDINKSLVVSLYNTEGVLVQQTKSAKGGGFHFTNLPADAEYVVKLEQLDDPYRMMFTDASGLFMANAKRINPNSFALPNADPEMIPLDGNATIAGLALNELGETLPEGTEVLLVDEQGDVVGSALVDANGDFMFEELPADQHYMLKFTGDEADDVELMFKDEKGNFLAAAKSLSAGSIELPTQVLDPESRTAPAEPALLSASIFGNVYEQLPGDVKAPVAVRLYNSDGVLVKQSRSDPDGGFRFINLPPDGGYVVMLDESDARHFKMMFTDGHGGFMANAERLDAKRFMVPVDKGIAEPSALASLQGSVLTDEGEKLPEGTKVNLVNEKGKVVGSALIDANGDFKFEKLPADANVMLQLDVDDSDDLQLVFKDKKGNQMAGTKRINASSFQLPTSDMLMEPMAQEKAISGTIYTDEGEVAPEGTKVVLVNDKGAVVGSALVDANGDFKFEKLPPDDDFMIQLESADTDDFKMVFHDKKGGVARVASKSAQGFVVEPEVAMAQMKQPTVLYGRIYEDLPGDVEEGTQVYLVNDEGAVVGSALIDANGDFKFENLPPDENYMLKLAIDGADNLNMMLLDERGAMIERIEPSKSGFIASAKAVQPAMPQTSTVSGRIFLDDAATIEEGTKVEIVNEKGEVLMVTETNQFGDFNFERLSPDQNYMVRIAGQDDAEMKIAFLDQEGGLLEVAEAQDGGFAAKADVVATVEPEAMSLFGRVFETLPGDVPEGMPVHVVDDQGEIVFTTYTDASGSFNFASLPKSENYTIQVEAPDRELRMVMMNESGTVTQLAEPTAAGFVAKADPIPAKQVETLALKGTLYEAQPGDVKAGTPVHIVDEQGEVLFTTYTDANGDFEFERLPPDQHYMLKVDAADDADFKMVFKDDQGAIADVVQQTSKGFEVKTETAAVKEQDLDAIRGKLYQYLPGDIPAGMPVQLLDDEGEVLMTTITDDKGNFQFPNLPKGTQYTLQVASPSKDIKMVQVDNKGALLGPMQQSDEGFVASIPTREPQLVQQSVAVSGKLEAASQQESLAGQTVNVVDDQGRVLFTTKTNELGEFNFERLPPDLNFSLQVEDASEDIAMAFFKDDGEKTEAIPLSPTGLLVVKEPIVKRPEAPEIGFTAKVLSSLTADQLAGKKVHIVNERGTVLFTTVIKEDATFRFTNLPPDKNYLFRIDATDKEMKIAFIEDGQMMEPIAVQIDGGFALKDKQPIVPLTTAMTLPGRLSISGTVETHLKGSDLAGIIVHIVNDQGEIVRSCDTKGTTRFAFLNLEPRPVYYLWVNRQDKDMNLRVKDGLGGNLELPRTAAGYFEYRLPSLQPGGLTIKTERNLEIPIEVSKTYTISNIYYEFDQVEHRIGSNHILDELARLLKENRDLKVEMMGHTDMYGPEAYNQWLSEQRAKSAKDYLIERGIEPERISSIGLGESQPVMRCDTIEDCTAEQHAQNRRTEFRVLK